MRRHWLAAGFLIGGLMAAASADAEEARKADMTYPVKHISVAVNCAADRVYKFVSNPANLPKWASGLSGSIEEVDGEWFANSPLGKIKVKFVDANQFGVLDHEVTIADGTKFYNPMRVVPNHQGSEVLFTLFRLPGVSDEDYVKDATTIEADFRQFKAILEK